MWYVTLYCSIVFEVQTQRRLLYSLQLNARKLSREKHSSRPFHCYEQFANSLSCFWVVETLKWKNAVLPTQLNKIRNNYKTLYSDLAKQRTLESPVNILEIKQIIIYLTLWLNAILCIMNFEKQGIQPSKSWTGVKQENDGGGAKKRRKTKTNCLSPKLDYQPLFGKWARAPLPNRLTGEDREKGGNRAYF